MKTIGKYLLLAMLTFCLATCGKGDDAGTPGGDGQEPPKPQVTSKDLRPLFTEYALPVKNQGDRGTCSIFALTHLLEFEFAHTRGDATPLSPEFLNWAANTYEQVWADGSFFEPAVEGFKSYGICSDVSMPYLANFNPNLEPGTETLADANTRRRCDKVVWIKEWDVNTGLTPSQLMQIKSSLKYNHPVAIGCRWPKGQDLIPGTDLMNVPPATEVFDGHSILVVGFVNTESVAGGGYLIFKNSWGSGWGTQGFARMPYLYALNYINDAVAIYLK